MKSSARFAATSIRYEITPRSILSVDEFHYFIINIAVLNVASDIRHALKHLLSRAAFRDSARIVTSLVLIIMRFVQSCFKLKFGN